MRTSESQTIRLSEYKRPEFTTDFVDLNFDIQGEEVKATSKVTYKRTDLGEGLTELVLDAENPNTDPDDPNADDTFIVSVKVNGWEMSADHGYTFDEDSNQLRIPVEIDDDEIEVEITTRLVPSKNSALSGLYDSDSAFTTQCESQGFRRIMPFLDRPDVMAQYRVRIEADKDEKPVLLSNGNQTSKGDAPGGRHWAVFEDPWPKPSYLFATVNGKLDMIEDQFTTKSGRDVTIRAYTEEGESAKAKHALEAVKKSMKWDEDTFDAEYDLDVFSIVAIAKFNAGAMENKSLNVFRDSAILADPDIATDANFHNIDRIVGHEYFHNWSGDRVTLANWFYLTVKEGLTVNREQMFTAHLTSEGKDRIVTVQGLRSGQFTEDDGPMAHPALLSTATSVDNFYTGTVYKKGSEIIRMMKTFMGEDKFIEGVKDFFHTYDGQAAELSDFIDSMERVSGMDFAGDFHTWYTQSGRPTVSAHGEYDADRKTYTLTLEQDIKPTLDQAYKDPLVIPVEMALIDDNGNEIPLMLKDDTATSEGYGAPTRVITLSEEKQTFIFKNVTAEPAFHSLFREFSAPVTYKPGLTTEQLQKQLLHDTDGFNRWDAGQKLAMDEMIRLYTEYEATGRLPEVDRGYLDTYGSVLTQQTEDKALHALSLSLPTITELEAEIGQSDPGIIIEVMKKLRGSIAQSYKADMEIIFGEVDNGEAYAFDYEQVGNRDLKRLVTGYLSKKPIADTDIDRLADLYWKSDNMTDKMIAMSNISDHDVPERTAIFDDFYEKFKDDSLTIQKWMALQAYSNNDNITDVLDEISGRSWFNWTNPGHLQSLFGAFSANYQQFHREDGHGYEYMADIVLKVDKKNGQTAARMVTPLTDWRKYTENHQVMMIAQLERMAATPGLSENTKEKVNKSLPNTEERRSLNLPSFKI